MQAILSENTTQGRGAPRLYPDVCVLCRPFDDQRHLRIRTETGAIYLLFEHIRAGMSVMMVSPARILALSIP